jgi:hypothetical protein
VLHDDSERFGSALSPTLRVANIAHETAENDCGGKDFYAIIFITIIAPDTFRVGNPLLLRRFNYVTSLMSQGLASHLPLEFGE